MRALGFNVRLHRTLAFTFAAFIAAFAGILAVWYNRRISPGSINLGQTIDVLVIAVIGGLYRIEGAWVGALTFALLDNYSREWTPEIGNVLGPERFNTLLGIIFLIIVLVSPGGLVGLWEKGVDRLRRRPPKEVARHHVPRPRLHRGLRVAPHRPLSSDGHERREGFEGTQATGARLRHARTGGRLPRDAATAMNPATRTRLVNRRRRLRSRSPTCPTARAPSARSSSRTSPGRTWRSIKYAGAKPAGEKPSDGIDGATGRRSTESRSSAPAAPTTRPTRRSRRPGA